MFFLRGPGFVSVYLGEREKNQLSGNLSAMMGTQSVIFQQHGHKNGNLISVWFGVCAFFVVLWFLKAETNTSFEHAERHS